jgi:hypothetical protein
MTTKDGAAVLTSTAADATLARRFLIDGAQQAFPPPPGAGAPALTITSC